MNNPDNLSIAPINVIEKVSVGINVYIFFFFLLSFRLPRNIDWWRMHSRMGCRTNCEMLQGSECPWTLNTNTNYNHLQHRWWRWTRSEWLVLVNGRIMTDGEWFMKRKEFFLSYFDSRFSGLEEISEVQAIPAFVRFDIQPPLLRDVRTLMNSTSPTYLNKCERSVPRKGGKPGAGSNDYELKLKIEKKVELTNGDGWKFVGVEVIMLLL